MGFGVLHDDQGAGLDYLGGTGSVSKFLLNIGAGIEYDITSKIAVNADIKYQYIKDFSRLPISIGVAYKF